MTKKKFELMLTTRAKAYDFLLVINSN